MPDGTVPEISTHSKDPGRRETPGKVEKTSAGLSSSPSTKETRPALDAVRESLNRESGTSLSKDLPIRWPHESPKPGWRRKLFHVPRRPRVHEYAGIPSTVESQKAAMRRLNGPEAEVLGDKYTFVDVVKKMGYTAPKQTLIKTDQTSEERLALVSKHFTDQEQPVICKPHNGKGGMGIVEVSAGELPEFISSLSQDYIIQERVPIKGEIRYVRQVDERGGVIRRIYDEKGIPKVLGDGTKTKGQLIREGNVPWYSKAATTLINLRSLGTVFPEGNSVHLSFFGVPHKGEAELEWGEQKKQRVDNMDHFMKQFVADLEIRVGTQLPYLCFDIGVIDPTILDEPYNFEKMKANLVPFESQMPFSLWGYVKRSSETFGQMYNTAKTLYGAVLAGKKRDFLTRRSSISKETGQHIVEQEYNFGRGEVTVMRVTPQEQKEDQTGKVLPPLVFVHGYGQGGTLKDNLALFAEEGERDVVGVAYTGKRKLKIGSQEIAVGEDKVKVPRYQVDKAHDIIDALDALHIENASIVGTSEGAFRAAIVAALDQDRIDHGILVHPAGMGRDIVSTVSVRVMHQFAKNAARKLRERGGVERERRKKTLSGNPLQLFAEGWTVAYGRIAHLIPLLGKKLSVAAGEGDVIYSERRLRRKIKESDIFRLFVTKGGGHGIGQRRETVREILAVLEEMEDSQQINSEKAEELE